MMLFVKIDCVERSIKRGRHLVIDAKKQKEQSSQTSN